MVSTMETAGHPYNCDTNRVIDNFVFIYNQLVTMRTRVGLGQIATPSVKLPDSENHPVRCKHLSPAFNGSRVIYRIFIIEALQGMQLPPGRVI